MAKGKARRLTQSRSIANFKAFTLERRTDNDGEGVKYPEHQPSSHNSPSSHRSPLTEEPEEIRIPVTDQEDCQEDQLEALASLIPSVTNCPFPTLTLIMAVQTQTQTVETET